MDKKVVNHEILTGWTATTILAKHGDLTNKQDQQRAPMLLRERLSQHSDREDGGCENFKLVGDLKSSRVQVRHGNV